STIEKQLVKFWELEDINDLRLSSHKSDTDPCETLFQETTQRDSHGRFVVKLPFKNTPPQLGLSHNMALKRFKSLEKKFSNDPQFKQQYINFIREYLDLEHMELVPPAEAASFEPSSSFYLSHHGVIKLSSSTTRLRVVFDGSAKSSN